MIVRLFALIICKRGRDFFAGAAGRGGSGERWRDTTAFAGAYPLNRANLCSMDAWVCIRRLWSKLIACRSRGWDTESSMGAMRGFLLLVYRGRHGGE